MNLSGIMKETLVSTNDISCNAYLIKEYLRECIYEFLWQQFEE